MYAHALQTFSEGWMLSYYVEHNADVRLYTLDSDN